MNILRLIDDGRFSVKSVAFASVPAAPIDAPAHLRAPDKPLVPRLRVLPNSRISPGVSLHLATETARASGLWEDIAFTVLIFGGVVSVVLALFEAFRV